MRELGRPPELPLGWYTVFSRDSQPGRLPIDCRPPLSEIVAQLRRQHARLKWIIGGLTQMELDGSTASNPNRPVRYGIVYGLHDEACHSGKMYLLLKMQSQSRTQPGARRPG
jgi:hypothetical protein